MSAVTPDGWQQHCDAIINGPPQPRVNSLKQSAPYAEWLACLRQHYHHTVKQPIIGDKQAQPTMLQLLAHPMSGQHVYEMIRSQPLVVDLLLSFYVKAILDTAQFRDVAEPCSASGARLVSKEKGAQGVRELVDKIPPLSELTRQTSCASLSRYLNAVERRLFRLLRWLLVYQPIPLRCVDPSDHIELPGCTHQFAVDQPAAALPGLLAGVVLPAGFHGSPLHNWHSILHHGLRSSALPGTGQSGAALWVAADVFTSYHFSTKYVSSSPSWKNSQLDGGYLCMAVVDVATSQAQQVLAQRNQGYCHVEANERAVSVRALLLIEPPGDGSEVDDMDEDEVRIVTGDSLEDQLAAWWRMQL